MIVFLHGAYSASDSFNYFKLHGWHDQLFINYDCNGNLIEQADKIRKSIQNHEPIDLIGHSLGGVISLTMANRGLNVRSIVTLAAPFGGIGAFWPPKTIGSEILKLRKICKTIPENHQFYVSTSGHNPWLLSRNDGVVSLSSQRSIPNANYIEVESNHFGILLNNEVIDGIKKFHKELS